MNKKDKFKYFNELCIQLSEFNDREIEENFLEFFLKKLKIRNNKLIESKNFLKIEKILLEKNFPIDIEILIEFFGFLFGKNNKNNIGVVFTPKYISDFMVEKLLENITEYNENIKIVEPACGCGIFIISVIEYLNKKFKVDIDTIIKNNILGMDIIEDNVRITKKIIQLFSFMNKGNIKIENINIQSGNSLDITKKWSQKYNVKKIDYVIGNPPYINTHDMDQETVKFLRKNYHTTKKGVFNIFYAFLEKSISEITKDGEICFIVPNNLFYIKSAEELRKFLKTGNFIETIIDFTDNMIFNPIRTYNCILKLNKNRKSNLILYKTINKTEYIEKELENIEYNEISNTVLKSTGWNLNESYTLENIEKIESQDIKIKDYISTGIATLKDAVYMVEKKGDNYLIEFNNKIYYIDSDLVKELYKVPELKKALNYQDIVRYIIFPYSISDGGYKPIDEETMKKKFIKTYKYFLDIKNILLERDNGKIDKNLWYAYGRSQGLNKFGKKILFPTFSDIPKFTVVDNKNSLFCNGYAIYENDYFELDVLVKILNSFIMEYYIKNTSYSIEGGYYCYQKKYIEKFSLPVLSKEELLFIKENKKKEIDEMLIRKYNLSV